MRTRKQRSRQEHRDTHGRYEKVNPCYCCGKSAGVDYVSHPMTDRTDPGGRDWGDTALCLCAECLNATEDMVFVHDFLDYVYNRGGYYGDCKTR